MCVSISISSMHEKWRYSQGRLALGWLRRYTTAQLPCGAGATNPPQQRRQGHLPAGLHSLLEPHRPPLTVWRVHFKVKWGREPHKCCAASERPSASCRWRDKCEQAGGWGGGGHFVHVGKHLHGLAHVNPAAYCTGISTAMQVWLLGHPKPALALVLCGALSRRVRRPPCGRRMQRQGEQGD